MNGLLELMENYFQNLFSTMGTNFERVVSKVQPGISEFQNNMLIEDVKQDKFKASLFSMDLDKAPGSNGYTLDF